MSKAIVTLAIGSAFEEMGKYTHPLMKRYAEKCGSDFIVISEPKLIEKTGLMTYEKFQVAEQLSDYDQIVFIDTDIVVLPNAPNLFELVAVDTFAAANEEGYSMSKAHKDITQKLLGEVSWKQPYFNSGVMVFGNAHKEIFNIDNPLFNKWVTNDANKDHIMSDQPIINYLVNYYGFPFMDLTYKFNHTRVIKDTQDRFNSYFIHYAGPSGHRYGTRMKQIELDCAVAKNPLLYFISRKLPLYRWAADRLNFDFIKYLALSRK